MHAPPLFVYVHVFVCMCVWPALCGITECCYMWVCNNMPGRASELSETFETMVTTHFISTLAKAQTNEEEERRQREEMKLYTVYIQYKYIQTEKYKYKIGD